MPTFALVAGGGTGGHVMPGLALARALVGRGHDPGAIRFVGSSRGVEARLVPEAGFDVTLLPGRGIQRRLTPANLAAAWGLARAAGRAYGLVRRLRPRVVVVVGGYAALPCALAARLRRVPVVVMEQNAVPGRANRLAGRFAAACAVTFPGTPLPRATVTGNPVRPEFVAAGRRNDPAAARAALGLPQGRRLLVVLPGALGSPRFNDAVLGLVAARAGDATLAVHHVTGERNLDDVTARAPRLPEGGAVYRAVGFEPRADLALEAADVVLGRASSGVVSELAVVARPAVLVPWDGAADAHQRANAAVVAAAGAAVVVTDGELTAERLGAEIDALGADAARAARLAEALAGLARPDAAERVADLVEAHALAPSPQAGR